MSGSESRFPKSLIEFQGRFASKSACAEYLFERRWPQDLGDRRHDHARQQAAADDLVLGRVSHGNALQWHLGTATAEPARPGLVPNRLDVVRQAAPGYGQSGT